MEHCKVSPHCVRQGQRCVCVCGKCWTPPWSFLRSLPDPFMVAVVKQPTETPFTTAVTADHLRSMGWSVAVHNDYKLNGASYTFWLFTKGHRCAKGEGRTDAEALEKVLADIDGKERET